MGVVTKPVEVILASRDSSARKIQEPRETDSGFAIAMQAPPRPTIVHFYCQSPKCPGFSYSASEHPHPIATCGTKYNSQDLPHTTAESEKEIMESTQPISEPNASEQPERPSDFAQVVKLPDPKDTPITDYLNQVWLSHDHYLEVVGIGSHELVMLASYRKLGETSEWSVYSIVGAELRSFLRACERVEVIPDWVMLARKNRRDAFQEGISKALSEDMDPVDELSNAAALVAHPDPFIDETRAWCKRIADELGVDAADVQRLMGTVFQSIEQFVTLKEITSSSPVVAAVKQKFQTASARSYLFQLADGILKGPIRETIEQATQEQINHFDVKIDEAATRLDELKANIESTIGNLEEQLPASDGDSVPIGVQLKELKNEVSKILDAYQAQLESLLEKFEAINKDLSKVERRMDDVEKNNLNQELARKHLPGHRNTKTDQRLYRENNERKRRARRLQKEIDEQPDELEDEDLEDEDLEDEDLEEEEGLEEELSEDELDDEFDDELDGTGFKDPRRAIDAVKRKTIPPVRKRGRGRPKGSKKASKKPLAVKTAKKTAKKAASKPKQAEKVPLTRPTPGMIDAFMGKNPNSSIRGLLKRIHTRKMAKFIKQAEKGMPPMKLTPWTPAEQGKFAQWFYGRRRG